MKDYAGRRRDKQPLDKPSAGSTFKRPEGYFAGKLIMDSGLRGFQVGGAMISDKHCGFVVNTGEATCEDVIHLIQEVKRIVKEKFDVELEPYKNAWVLTIKGGAILIAPLYKTCMIKK